MTYLTGMTDAQMGKGGEREQILETTKKRERHSSSPCAPFSSSQNRFCNS